VFVKPSSSVGRLALAMPFEISFHPSWRLAITRAWGQITLDDLLSYRQELAARLQWFGGQRWR